MSGTDRNMPSTSATTGSPTNGRVPFGSILQRQEGMNALNHFINPPDDLPTLLMRTDFRDEEQADACSIMLFKADIFKYSESFYNLVRYKQTTACSVGGRSTLLLLMGVCQIIAPSLLSGVGKKIKQLKNAVSIKDGTEGPSVS